MLLSSMKHYLLCQPFWDCADELHRSADEFPCHSHLQDEHAAARHLPRDILQEDTIRRPQHKNESGELRRYDRVLAMVEVRTFHCNAFLPVGLYPGSYIGPNVQKDDLIILDFRSAWRALFRIIGVYLEPASETIRRSLWPHPFPFVVSHPMAAWSTSARRRI